MPPPAIVLNMFYTGLGIARSLGEQGIRVLGLSAHPGYYGNYTRYAKIRSCPDSRENPEALFDSLLQLARELGERAVIFPTRDDDVLFLDRYREELGAHFDLVVPPREALQGSLNKWETYRWAQVSGVSAPRCWMLEKQEDVRLAAGEAVFPCVLKPLSAHLWRQRDRWALVGGRKAICVASAEELDREYTSIARIEGRALLQEMVPGGDDCLWIAACYMNKHSEFVGGFTARKVLQVPEIFGTGCIVQGVNRPDLLEKAAKLLQTMHFAGIAEVEFKSSSVTGEYELIEINPRPWDQHRLGGLCGVDLIHLAYREAAGLPIFAVSQQKEGSKWIAEDVFSLLLLKSLWGREMGVRALLRLAAGERTFAIWYRKDPLPFLVFVGKQFVPGLLRGVFGRLQLLVRGFRRPETSRKKDLPYAKNC